jgi:hypothetical protein
MGQIKTARTRRIRALPPFFSLSSTKGGEGRGEEADYSSSNPLAPALSPLGRGEGVGGSAGMCLIADRMKFGIASGYVCL